MRGCRQVVVAGRAITVIAVAEGTAGDALTRELTAGGVVSSMPVVVVVGGAGGVEAAYVERCARLFAEVLIPVLTATGATVVDGGTDAGITHLLGAARRQAGAGGQHVGVVAGGTVAWPDEADADGKAPLEPNHTHVVVVPGADWGDEVPWLSSVAAAIAGDAPSLTLLANGGEIAYRDVEASLAAGRRIFVLAGTGRTADEIADAAASGAAAHQVLQIARSPLVTVLPDELSTLIDTLASALR